MSWREDIRALKLAYLKEHHPDFYQMSGGERMKILPYSDQSTNKLTTAVCDWLKYAGHYCNRINSQGQMRKIKGQMRYTHGASNLGTADIDCIIDGKPVKIEIKCKATGDKVSKHQKEEQRRIENAGGVYLVVEDMPSFISWYYGYAGKLKQTKTVLG